MRNVVINVDVLIIGAGAAGLMCAANAGYRGRSVYVIDHANKPGKKILMSGGGRCNFTNLDTAPKHFLSANPYFCISALKRYTPYDFVELVDRHSLSYIEKAAGQFFCEHSAKDLLTILLTECEWAGVNLQLTTKIEKIEDDKVSGRKKVITNKGVFSCESLVIATGGLSIPTMGATSFGYEIAKQFNMDILPTRAGLVPITLQPEDKERFASLAGVSCDITANVDDQVFNEPMLFTHRGISGPAILQISSYWEPSKALKIDLLPSMELTNVQFSTLLEEARHSSPKKQVTSYLANLLPKKLVDVITVELPWLDAQLMGELSNTKINELTDYLHDFKIKPNGTEGYRTAEVTLGGVDTNAISSKTFEAKDTQGLFFIGEVLDVTGHLGGYNFQWAWASGYCAAQYV